MSHEIRLIVGLGNPGPEYAHTRHNAGAWYVAELAARNHGSLREDPKYYGLTARITLHGQEVRLLIPTTFMNLSGKSVSALAKFFQIPVESILVAHDELDLPPGVARFKQGGGHGGSHPHLVHEFVTSILEDRTPFPSDIDAAYWTGVGLLAHESAMEGGTVKSLPKYEEL